MKKQLVIPALVFASLAATSAHAGMFEWVDNMFTFREEQKNRIAPRQALPPKTVWTPSVGLQEQQDAQYYIRGDLVPKDYLHGSASKVMRPNTLAPSQQYAAQTARQPQQPTRPTGYDAIVQQERENRAHARPQPRIYVGEPGTTPKGSAGAHVAHQPVKIGKPVRSWRDTPEEYAPTPRPGDYDYKKPQPARFEHHVAVTPVEESPWSTRPQRVQREYPSLADSKRARAAGTSSGQVSTYEVENGDTLSGISDKPQIYGDWALWPLIWDANRATVKDPDMIRPRQQLDIPREYGSAEASSARHRAWDKGKVIYLNDGE